MERGSIALRVFAALATVATVLQSAYTSSPAPWPYLQVYPAVNESDDRTPLYFALELSFEGAFTSIGALPGVQIALDYVNSNPKILPGHTLHYTLTDSKLACVSSSPFLANRERFRYYFQVQANELIMAQGFLGIIKYFGWKKIAIITQNEGLFRLTMNDLKRRLKENEIDFSEKLFDGTRGVASLGTKPFDPDSRIFLLSMYSYHARHLMCEAYKRGLHYPKYQFLLIGWYEYQWWIEPDPTRDLGCTDKERISVLGRALAIQQIDSSSDANYLDEGTLTISEFEDQYWRHVASTHNAELNLSTIVQGNFVHFSHDCYDAALALAFALDKTNSELLNSDIQGQIFSLEHFTYEDSPVVEKMVENLENTDFVVLEGHVINFLEDGTRNLSRLQVFQYQPHFLRPQLVEIGTVDASDNNALFILNDKFTETEVWPDGVPNDGIPIKELVGVTLPLTVVFALLAIAGVVFALVCLAMNFIYRDRKFIRLSSPNVSYVIGIGALVLYVYVILLTIPTTTPQRASIICNLEFWLGSIGHTLTFGMVVLKMTQEWCRITKNIIIHDWHLIIGIFCLLALDVISLGVYTLVEGIRGELGIELTQNKENPDDMKGLPLHTIGIILAFGTRSEKERNIHAPKHIVVVIYISTALAFVLVLTSTTVSGTINLSKGIDGSITLVGGTAILVVMFVPKMVAMWQETQEQGKEVVMSTEQLSNVPSGEETKYYLYKRVRELESLIIQAELEIAMYESKHQADISLKDVGLSTEGCTPVESSNGAEQHSTSDHS